MSYIANIRVVAYVILVLLSLRQHICFRSYCNVVFRLFSDDNQNEECRSRQVAMSVTAVDATQQSSAQSWQSPDTIRHRVRDGR